MINTTKSVDKTRKMIAEMSNLETLKWVGVALGIHAVVILLTSISDIRAMVNPPVPPPLEEPVTATQPATTQPADSSNSAKSSAKPAAEDANEDKMITDRKDSEVIKKITATPKPNEIPTQPSNGGFEIDEK